MEDIQRIFENDDIVVLNKPGGMLSIEDGFKRSLPNLRSLLISKYGKIWVVHRLDKDTSGIILFAKNEEAHKKINYLFSNRKVKKTYQALVYGAPIWDSKTINLWLKINGDRKHRTVVDFTKGKKAVTQLRVIQKRSIITQLEISPETGYTHQIRSHCAAIGHPIVGDELYFRGCDLYRSHPLRRLYLHAYSLELPYPSEIYPNIFVAPLPCYFDKFIQNFG